MMKRSVYGRFVAAEGFGARRAMSMSYLDSKQAGGLFGKLIGTMIAVTLALFACAGAVATLVPECAYAVVATSTYYMWGQDYNTGSYLTRSVIDYSYLHETPQGTLERVEWQAQSGLFVEEYTKAYGLVSQRHIDPRTYELSSPGSWDEVSWGGFYSGSTYNFVVTGQENYDDSDSVPVVRVTRYAKDWAYVDYVELRGIDVSEPFESGSCRMVECNGNLVIHTSRLIYAEDGGLRHQANISFIVDADADQGSMTAISTNDNLKCYVSHSFNQLVATDGKSVYAADHGDAYPRAIISQTLLPLASRSSYSFLDITGECGENDTGATIGGYACSGSNQVAVGTSYDQSNKDASARNVWFSTTKGGEQAFKWLTSYEYGSNGAATPQMVKVSDSRFLVIWASAGPYGSCPSYSSGESTLYYEFVDADGNSLSPVYSETGAQSDCQPTVVDGKAIWYAGYDEFLAFYSIDLNTGSFGRSVLQAHYHKNNSTTTNLVKSATCTETGLSEEVIWCSCGAEVSRKTTEVAALGHLRTVWKPIVPATESSTGTSERTCLRCGDTETKTIPMVDSGKTSNVYRLYNAATSEHLWTTSYNEYGALVGYGWTQEGVAWSAPSSGAGVYRLYNPGLGTHHFTSNVNEANVLIGQYGWVADNNGDPLFYSDDASASGATPVYRLYNDGLSQHMLTMDANEYNVLATMGWAQEGIAFYAMRK